MSVEADGSSNGGQSVMTGRELTGTDAVTSPVEARNTLR